MTRRAGPEAPEDVIALAVDPCEPVFKADGQRRDGRSDLLAWHTPVVGEVATPDRASSASQQRRGPRRGLRVLVISGLVAISASLVAVRAYQAGGAHLSGGGFGVGAPVTIGEEFHTSVRLDTGGRDVVLLSATPATSETGLEVTIRLVHGGPYGNPQVGGIRGPLGSAYEFTELAGRTVRSVDRTPLWLDLRVIASRPGVHRLEGIAITYRAGPLRTRTAGVPAGVCLWASADWRRGRCESLLAHGVSSVIRFDATHRQRSAVREALEP